MDDYRLKYYGVDQLENLPCGNLSTGQKAEVRAVAQVLPFRVNNYVLKELVDWDNIPEDPIFQLTFLQRGMLREANYRAVQAAMRVKDDKTLLRKLVSKIRDELNPHPAGQLQKNVPSLEEEPVSGIQHKYRETALMFPMPGQTCFAYCTFCFRWPQFIGDQSLKFATDRRNRHVGYIKEHKELTDILITGGDPMTMRAKHLAMFIEPLLELDHIRNIRIGTKVLSYWPYRFLSDRDSEEYLSLFERVAKAGKHLAFMAHINHSRELSTPAVEKAVQRLRNVGVTLRCQAPLLDKINNDPDEWVAMWNRQVQLGLIPYYMFIERDTGPSQYFGVPLDRAYEVYTNAYKRVSGLARTVRGPSMSSDPGKVLVDGICTIGNQKVFILKLLQARNPELVNRTFFAKFNEEASWLSDLEPCDGQQWPWERN